MTISCLVLGGAGCGPTGRQAPTAIQTEPERPSASFGVPAALKTGAEISYDDGLKIRLKRMDDSRCPQKVQCVWQGELAAALELRGGDFGDTPIEMSLGTVSAPSRASGSYVFTVQNASTDSLILVTDKPGTTLNGQEDFPRVSRPLPGQIVASPLIVTGVAPNSWYFEASFPISLTDADGRVLAIAIAQAQSDWMTAGPVPFKATLNFDAPTAATGVLTFKKDNPSGLPEHDRSYDIPVRFLKP